MLKSISVITLLIGSFQLTIAQSTGTIEGKVTDKKHKEALLGAVVNIFQGDSLLRTVSTGYDKGTYRIDNIEEGAYVVEFSYLGYQSISKNAKVKAGQTTKIDVIMKDDASVELAEVSVRAHNRRKLGGRGKRKYKNTRRYRAYGCPSFGGSSTSSTVPTSRNTESYASIEENEFKNVSEKPLSTFSIDVDRASYANVRRFIDQSQKPPKDAVRIEEMLNYFDYNYSQPKNEHPFSIITEASDCPWNKDAKLLHIGLQGKKIDLDDAPYNNLVFLMDVSGSMESPNKLPLVKESLKLLVQNMRGQDRIAIVVYAGAAGVVLPSTAGSNRVKILAALDKLSAGGSTAGGEGIELAYAIAKKNYLENGNNRVILATDGDFNVGVSDEAELQRLIVKKRKDNVFLSVLGFGTGNYKDSKMEILADRGNGNYAYIDNIKEAKKTLVKEIGGTLYTIAKDVKIQIEFDSNFVQSYRLVGYENRLLNDEDFKDDKKDAGELGAGHTVTALYEVVLADKKSASKEGNLMMLNLRYKAPKDTISQLIEHPVGNDFVALEKTSDNFRFSASVAGFGMLLRDSKFKNDLTYQRVMDLAKGAKGVDKEGYREEFIGMVKNVNSMTSHAKK